MGGAVAFDTLEFVETLKAGGIPEGQAKVFAVAIRQSQDASDVATKQDVKDLRGEILDVRKDIAHLKDSLESRMDKAMLRMIIQFCGIVTTVVSIAVAVIKLL